MGYYDYGSSRDSGSLWGILVGIVMFVFVMFVLSRCTSEQSVTKNWGGTMNIEIEPNQKLVEVTWKDDSLWLLTKDMQEQDIAENYRFQEKDVTGILEGTVFIEEKKPSNEEFDEYKVQKQLEKDYNKEGNFVYSAGQTEPEVVFIKYDEVNDKYIKIKDYIYNEETNSIVAK